VTTAIAIYAALVSTAAVTWQVVSWRLGRKTTIEIKLSRRAQSTGGKIEFDNIIVSVVNFSDHPVRIEKAMLTSDLHLRALGEYHLRAFPHGNPFLGSMGGFELEGLARVVIDTRDSAHAVVHAPSLTDYRLKPWKGLKAYVLTSTGQVFASQFAILDGDEEVRETLKEILVAAEGKSLNSEDVKREVKECTGASASETWRALDRLRTEGLAGETPTRDEHGKVIEWRWFAKG
jgi:hypothetical protein